MWVTEELRVFRLVMLSTTIFAAVLVVYFEWRARLLDRIRCQRNSTKRQRREESCFRSLVRPASRGLSRS